MATWVVGDVQGCRKPLKRLLRKVGFSWDRDQLWATGDIVNRGPNCLKTLRYFYRHRENVRMVLGNHDLHLLAVAAGTRAPSRSDTLAEILAAPDRNELLAWLQSRPLVYQDHGVTLVHAGIPPQWSVTESAARAREVEAALQGPDSHAFFGAMYGNKPAVWSAELSGMARLRVITNYFTRMRYCSAEGVLDLVSKGPLANPAGPAAESDEFDAWFNLPRRRAAGDTIIFGHWASLQGETGNPHAIALDTGCVWGNCMTLYCVETHERVTESCKH